MSNRDTDFIGFTIGNTHSSNLNILRVSDGSRYNENLLPTLQDKTVQIPGGDGTYYFGSYYTQRPFNIQIAFDSMTESNMRELRQIMAKKELQQLIFDEANDRFYMVKASGTPNIKYVPFEINEQTIYKGEGTLSFTAYYPFAQSATIFTDTTISYNGDQPADWEFVAPIGEFTGEKNIKGLTLDAIEAIGQDTQILISSKTGLIEGLKDGARTGNLYNKYIISGDFEKISNETTEFSTGGVNGTLSYREIYF